MLAMATSQTKGDSNEDGDGEKPKDSKPETRETTNKNKNDFLTPAKAKKENTITMRLFNKLANSNTIEDGDVENEDMQKILSANNIKLDGNKEKALFLLQYGSLPTGCRLCCDYLANEGTRTLLLFPHLWHRTNSGFYRPKALSFCPNFFRLNLKERKKRLSELNICKTCMRPDHKADHCFPQKGGVCRDCRTHFLAGSCDYCQKRIDKVRHSYQEVFKTLAKGEGSKMNLMDEQGTVLAMHSQQKGMSFDRVIQSLQDMDPNIQQVKKRLT